MCLCLCPCCSDAEGREQRTEQLRKQFGGLSTAEGQQGEQDLLDLMDKDAKSDYND